METLDTYLGLKEIHLVWKILCIAPWARSKKYYYTWMSFIFCFNIFFVSRTIVDYLLCEDSKCVLNHVLYYVAGWSKVSQYLLYRQLVDSLLPENYSKNWNQQTNQLTATLINATKSNNLTTTFPAKDIIKTNHNPTNIQKFRRWN